MAENIEDQDTRLGKLIDITLKHIYGEDFVWTHFEVENLGEGHFVVQIETEQGQL